MKPQKKADSSSGRAEKKLDDGEESLSRYSKAVQADPETLWSGAADAGRGFSRMSMTKPSKTCESH
ncbi:MAG: hypothetical protein AB2L14_02005 [Candidatus Xenobiia bacterium LiM19]